MEAISGAVANCVTLAESILTSVLGNTTLLIVVGAGFLTLGVRVLRRLIGVSKSVG